MRYGFSGLGFRIWVLGFRTSPVQSIVIIYSYSIGILLMTPCVTTHEPESTPKACLEGFHGKAHINPIHLPRDSRCIHLDRV